MFNKSTLYLGICIVISPSVFADVIETTRLYTFGEPKYAEGFKHLEYVNPNAPKGGTITSAATGTYDNFNRYSQRGNFAAALIQLYDPLMAAPSDEVGIYYGLIAKKVRYSDDYMWLEIDLEEKARFHDGEPIKASDVEFTFYKLVEEGVPQVAKYYEKVKSVKAIADRTVRIEMKEADREVLFSVVQGTRIFPEHYWKDKNLAEPLSTPPLGSGPYMISDYKMGQSLTYTLVDDYWAKDHPLNKGRNNFEREVYDYYRDTTVQLEAFKAGEFDLRQEGTAKYWATSYTGSNVDKGYIIQEEIPDTTPQRMQALIYNVQSAHFQDVRVREALSYLLDFEWMNKNLFYSQYSRTSSYFQNTEYQQKGNITEAEIAVLEAIKDSVPKRVFGAAYSPPVTDGSGRIRSQTREALALLKEAGWENKDGTMTHTKTGKPFVFEIMAYSPTTERVVAPFQKNLKAIGIELKIRMVDTSQYLKRMHDREFDMIFQGYAANAFPSPALKTRWHSKYIDSTYNLAGVNNPAVDYLVDEIEKNQDNPEQLKALGPAFDRVLMWNYYVIPTWHGAKYRVASWDKFARPNILPKYDLGLDTWWIDESKAQKLPVKRR